MIKPDIKRLFRSLTTNIIPEAKSPKYPQPTKEERQSYLKNLNQFTPDRIRNFSIIAHIDHGKSTLADRLLELTGTISKIAITTGKNGAGDSKTIASFATAGSGTVVNASTAVGSARVLDKLKVERERGITVKAQTVSMFYRHPETGITYLINLIDTPGHVDFSYEVGRSLKACQGCLMLVDVSGAGVQAQTVSNYYAAAAEDLVIVPVLNKIDLPGANPSKVLQQLESTFDIPAESSANPILQISAKTGLGVASILPRIISEIPHPPHPPPSPPQLNSTHTVRALLFDSWYDSYVGVICLVYIASGTLQRGTRLTSHHTKQTYETTQLGIMYPDPTPTQTLTAGQVGFIHLGMKSTRDACIGDTLYSAHAGQPPPPAFPGFKPAKSMVFAGAYPPVAADFPKLCDAIDRLCLNDASISVSRETSGVLGQGFRLGFLGTLHMDVVGERLEEEFGAVVIRTAPTVTFLVEYLVGKEGAGVFRGGIFEGGEIDGVTIGGKGDGTVVKVVRNPADFPEPDEFQNVCEIYQPVVVGTLMCPVEYVGALMELCGSHRGEQLEYTTVDDSRVLLKYKLPMTEILTEFHDTLKSRTQGYATFDYEPAGYEPSDLVKVNLLLNGSRVDALSTIVHRSSSDRVAKAWTKKLSEIMDRQLIEIVIQGAVNGKVVARETVKALRKDVTAKLYGGDVTRKMKLLEKQKEGKKRMKAVAGGIQLSHEAFLGLVNQNKKGKK